MRKHFQTIPCTVLLDTSQLTSILASVDARLREHQDSKNGPLMRIGSESHDVGAVLRSRWHLYDFINSLDLPQTPLSAEEELSPLDMFLRDDTSLPSVQYSYEANFYSVRVIMSIYEECEEKLIQEEFQSDAVDSDWAPPENFAYGTDDEQEVWQSHQSQQEK